MSRRFFHQCLPVPILVLCATGVAFAQGVTLYEHTDYRGRSQVFYDDMAELGKTNIGNDRVSSVLVDPGCEVTLYSDSDFRGRSQTLREDAPDLDRLAIRNDSVSSIKVDCRRPRSDRPQENRGGDGVTAYSGTNYSGYHEVFRRDEPYLVDNSIGNDSIRSVRVPEGCEVTVYEHEDYGGRSVTLNRDHTDLARTQFGRAGASSLRVSCDRYRSNDYGNGSGDRYDDPRYDDRRARGVTFFRDEDFRGSSETYWNDQSNLDGSTVGNDRITSVRVDSGCRVVLYSDANFRGRSTELTRDIGNLKGTAVGNDTVSSFRIDCSRGRR